MTDQSPNDEPSNMQRALWAKAALTVFTADTYGGDHPDTMDRGDLETAIADLICDLLHFARLHLRMDAAEIHAHALRLFEQENAHEEDCDCTDRSWYGPYHDTQCPARPASKGVSLPTTPEKSQITDKAHDAMITFHTGIGIYRAFIAVDDRFKLEIRRNPPPPMASAQLILKVYPITDGEVWDDPYAVFAVDEGRIIELENEMKE
jgi:hypothetical protein